jgi:tetratricopeptide (TPR) repeat protein
MPPENGGTNGIKGRKEMKRHTANIAAIVMVLLGSRLTFGQTVSVEAKQYFERGIAAADKAKVPADYEVAIQEFERAASLAPDWPDVFYNLGLVQEGAEKISAPIRSYQRYLQLAPNADDSGGVKSRIDRLVVDMLNVLSTIGPEGWDAFIKPYSASRELATNFDDWPDIVRVDDYTIRVITNEHLTPAGSTYSYGDLRVAGPVIHYTIPATEWDEGTRTDRPEGSSSYTIEILSRVRIKVRHSSNVTGREFSDRYYEYRKK